MIIDIREHKYKDGDSGLYITSNADPISGDEHSAILLDWYDVDFLITQLISHRDAKQSKNRYLERKGYESNVG